jgi:hypothetical protein
LILFFIFYFLFLEKLNLRLLVGRKSGIMDLSTKAVWPESTLLTETAVGGLIPGEWDNTDNLPEVVDNDGTEEVQGANKYMYVCI